MSSTKIEWATKVWNPVTGCTKVSDGCKNCYAERFANRLQSNPKTKEKYSAGFRVKMHENELVRPIDWKKPERIFVCSMGDLFHDDVTFEFINAVFTIMRINDRHTYIILTKRPGNMVRFWDWKKMIAGGIPWQTKSNIWVGVTVENQDNDYRIEQLLQVKAKVRFISYEPALGPLNISKYLKGNCPWCGKKLNEYNSCSACEWDEYNSPHINWVIAGGETGPKARPTPPEWFNSICNQCKEANVPFFFKGWGDWKHLANNEIKKYPLNRLLPNYTDKTVHVKVGKKIAGRLLDGKEWNEFPILNSNIN